MLVNGKNYRTLWIRDNIVNIIDQTKLPFKFEIKKLKKLKDFCDAISKMWVRGAPLIGVTAAYGLAMCIKELPNKENIEMVYRKLFYTRPTAVNLAWTLNILKKELLKEDISKRKKLAFDICHKILEDDVKSSIQIAKNGFRIIEAMYKKKKKPINILTHCNAGWLATIDWGTALAPIYMAKRKKIPVHVWVDETRPRNQGSQLTAWELKNEKIPYTIIVDNAGGYLMQYGKVDLCIVGSDRTALNGDVCNKIGTYLKALASRHNSIPFYVALPSSTIDCKLSSGVKKIPIEERDGSELSMVKTFKNNKVYDSRIFFQDANVFNPAFDVTPARLVTGLITEYGICKPNKKSILDQIDFKNHEK